MADHLHSIWSVDIWYIQSVHRFMQVPKGTNSDCLGIGWSYIKYKELEDEPKTPTTTLQTFTYQKKTYLALGMATKFVLSVLTLSSYLSAKSELHCSV